MAKPSKEVQAKADAKRAGRRARAWTAVVYPDSAPENWQEILREQLIECLISPFHDKDVEPTGETKKAHWHVVLSFKNPTTYEKACDIFGAINAVVPPADQCKVKDFKQMARYLCHLDQPNKHRYPINEVISIGAVDYSTLVTSALDEADIFDELCRFIDDNCVLSYRQLCVYVRENRPEWRMLVYKTYASGLTRYIKSLAWEIETQSRK